ncbi:MAG TPA: hypothetical protein VFH93_02210 [Thermoleophilia bacterium]|nr:hypothetical protein [Thermoleophilia bacterium]HET6494701.1 hypothetical protein [Thermoleophilia bacterium]
MNEYHDTRLGDLIRSADEAPPLAADFEERLWARIEDERAGEPRGTRSSASRFAGFVRARRWGLAFAATTAAVAALVLIGLPGGNVAEKAPGGSAAQNPAAYVFTGPEPASAAEVARIVQEALRDATTIVADLYYCDYKAIRFDRLKADDNRTRLVLCADGSYRATPLERLVPEKWGDRTIDVPGIVGSDKGGDASYDATTGVRRSWGAGFDRMMVAPPGAYGDANEVPLEQVEAAVFVDAREETGCDPTGDSVGAMTYPAPDIGPTQFSGVVYALRASGDAALRATMFDGRPAWVVSCPVAPRPRPPGDEVPWPNGPDDSLIITVDKGTGLPVRSQQLAGDKVHAEWCLMNLQVDVRVPEDTFTLDFPSGLFRDKPVGSITRVDNGFRPVTLDQVESAIGRAALVPIHLPRDYELAQVAVKREDKLTEEDLGEMGKDSYWYMNKALTGSAIVALRYGRGFESLGVSTRVLDPTVTSERFSIDTDPFIREWPGSTDARTPVELTSGAFAGGRGFVVIAPLTTPHLWAAKDGMLLMVGGDASAEQLLAVANSIAVWEP